MDGRQAHLGTREGESTWSGEIGLGLGVMRRMPGQTGGLCPNCHGLGRVGPEGDVE